MALGVQSRNDAVKEVIRKGRRWLFDALQNGLLPSDPVTKRVYNGFSCHQGVQLINSVSVKDKKFVNREAKIVLPTVNQQRVDFVGTPTDGTLKPQIPSSAFVTES